MRKDIKPVVLPKSSIMGMKGEYSPDFLDQVLQHTCLIPYVGVEVQELVLDAFALTKSSDELDDFCRRPIQELVEWGKTHFPVVIEYHKAGFCKTDRMVVAILNDRLTTVQKFAKDTGFETVSDLMERLHKRLQLIIPWDKGMEDIYFAGPMRVPRQMTPKERAEQTDKKNPWEVPKAPLRNSSSKSSEPVPGMTKYAKKGKGDGKSPSKGKPPSPVKGKKGKGKGPPQKGQSNRKGKGSSYLDTTGAHPRH